MRIFGGLFGSIAVNMSARLREARPHKVFNVSACDLPQDKLPRCRDVVGRLLKIRAQKMEKLGKDEKHISVKELINQVTDETIAVWERASIPTKDKNRVRYLISKLWKDMVSVRKTNVSRGGQPAERLQERLETLFDISSVVRAPEHPEDVAFLVDQRSARRMSIGPRDEATTQRWQRREARRARELASRLTPQDPKRDTQPSPAVCGPRAAAQAAAEGIRTAAVNAESDDEFKFKDNYRGAVSTADDSIAACSVISDSSVVIAAGTEASACPVAASVAITSDPDYVPPRPRATRKMDLRPLAEAVDAAGVGTRKAVRLMSAEHTTEVTRKKLRLAIEKTRKEKLNDIPLNAADCTAVFCDGRNDQTLTQPQQSTSRLVKTASHNVSINMHPGDQYIGHFECEGRHTGEHVAHKLLDLLNERGIKIDRVTTVGGDGTNQVVSSRGGWMAQVEAKLGRPLTRVVCLCHHLELPYRKLFVHLDGKTTGPGTFEGPIGKQLRGPVHEMPVADFPVIECNDWVELPASVERELSTDVKLLYKCARSVKEGDASSVRHLAHGKVHHARWYTAQSRLLRLYMATNSPTPQLTELARYVVCVYVPMVVQVKHQWDLVHAARHLTEELRRQRDHFSGDILRVVQRSVTDNALMAHPESIVLGMLSDPIQEVRAEAVGLIIKAREIPQTGMVRRYAVPRGEVNVNANSYMELNTTMETIRSGKLHVEPPCTFGLTSARLAALVDSPLSTKVPSHTQSTERAVKLTTEAVATVAGADRQDGRALNILAQRRQQLP